MANSDFEVHRDGSVVVYTDGSCINNGRGNPVGGVGVWWGDNHIENYCARFNGRQTNNRAEIIAAIQAIRMARNYGFYRIIIRTDSQFLVQSATEWIPHWRRRGWILNDGSPVKNREDFEELVNEMEQMENVAWQKVFGHRGVYGNEMANDLAQRASRG